MLNRRAALVLATVAGLLITSTTASASSLTAGTVRCTITSRTPRMDLTRMVRGSAVVQCTSAAVVGIDVTVVEMDGSLEDRPAVVPQQTLWVMVAANTPTVVVTNRARCVNTEIGNEEYATRSRINLSGVASSWDRNLPDPDSFAC